MRRKKYVQHQRALIAILCSGRPWSSTLAAALTQCAAGTSVELTLSHDKQVLALVERLGFVESYWLF